MKRTKNKKRVAQKSMESVQRLEESLWWERFVNDIGLEPGVKE